MDATITLKQYLGKGKTFVIPDYQRGYIWGKNRNNSKDTDSATHMIRTILSKYFDKSTIFLQGVTVTETQKEIILVDGQQRTTFLYILLKILGNKDEIKIKYNVRNESEEFLRSLTPSTNFRDLENEEYQDIYFFKKTARIIKKELQNREIYDFDDLLNFILLEIKFLYINIPENQAKKIFTMMNGNRAKMLEQEIIKAELLRLASRCEKAYDTDETKYSREWELNLLRSRYAREWDKWIHWWNRDDVRNAFNIDTQLGWLLISVMPPTYRSSVTFESFCKEILNFKDNKLSPKAVFDRLRRTQKKFEDTFNDATTHNKIGAILRISNERETFIKYYFSNENVSDEELHRYYLCTFIGMTHKMIIGPDFKEFFKEKFNNELKVLKLAKLYEDEREAAYRLLLRLNIDEDNLQNHGHGRKFDFSIWNVRSLEHIYPKSKVFHLENEVYKRGDGIREEPPKEGSAFLLRENFGEIEDPVMPLGEVDEKEQLPPLTVTEHCIGNLVLLYKDENSCFNNNDFQKKKEIFLVGEDHKDRKELFKSRHLLHTIYHFSETDWGKEEIRKYFRRTLLNFRNAYQDIIDK